MLTAPERLLIFSVALNVIEPTFDRRCAAYSEYLYVIPWTGSAVPGSLKKKSLFIENIVPLDVRAARDFGQLNLAAHLQSLLI
jgi:hypothetical protein